MTITLEVSPELESQLNKAARIQGKDLSTYLLDSARMQLRPDMLPLPELRLLEVINAPIAPLAKQNRDNLISLRNLRQLDSSEEEKLYSFIDEVEIANAARWSAIVSLAELRGQSLSEVAHDLEIPL